ncbi:MAG: hypothetical protein ABFS32_20420, partial [Bacteroidota bacterium]
MKKYNYLKELSNLNRYRFLLIGLISLLLTTSYTFGQVDVTAATGGENICLNPGPTDSDWYSLSDIIVEETLVDDIGATPSKSLQLEFSGGATSAFEFDTGTLPTVSVSGADASIGSITFVSTYQLEINLDFSPASTSSFHTITIAGLKVKGVSVGSETILNTGDATIFGDNAGDGVNHGTLNAYAPPIPTLTPASQTICEGQTATITAGGGVSYEFVYDPGGSRTTVQSGASDTYSISSLGTGAHTYSVIVTNSNGCSDESASVTVTVNASTLSNTLSSDAVSDTSCDGESVIFTSTATGNSGSTTYEFFVDGVSQGAPAASNTFTTSTLTDGQEIYSFVYDASACSGVISNTITHTIIPQPSAGLSVSATSNTVCYGETAEITIGSSELNVEYQLQNNSDSSPLSNLFTGTGADLVITSYPLTANVTIKVYASSTETSNCAVDLSGTEAITIQSASPPTSTSPVEICEDDAIPSLTATGTNIIWYDDVGLTNQVGTGSPFTPSSAEVDNTTPGTYRLYATQTVSGCESAGTSVDVIVNPLPDATLSVNPASVNVCENSTTDITVVLSENNVNYQLLNNADDSPLSAVYVGDGGNLILTSTALTASVTIKVRATTPNSCVDDLTNTVAVTIDATPTSDAGSDDEVCSDQPTYTVSGSTSANGTITWTTSGSGTFVADNVDNPVYNIHANDITSGSVTLTKTVVSPGSCA